jgi:hypothetical protein
MFCRPAHLLARLADPLVRRLQRKFGRLTKESMIEAVAKTRTIAVAAVV